MSKNVKIKICETVIICTETMSLSLS